MNREEYLYKKELETNKVIARMMLVLAAIFVLMIVVVATGILEYDFWLGIMPSIVMLILIAIQEIRMFVFKKNDKYTKRFMIYTLYAMVLICYSLYSNMVIYVLFVIAISAIIYVDMKIVKNGTCVGILALFMGHVVVPGVLTVAQENVFNIGKVIVGEFLPQAVMFLATHVGVLYAIERSLETIDYMIENNDNLRISSGGFHRILVSSQTMLNATNYTRFVKKAIAAVKDTMKFLNNSDDKVKVKGVFIDQNGVYNIYNRRKGGTQVNLSIDGVEIKDRYMATFSDDTDGECIIEDDMVIMTFYIKGRLEGVILVDSPVVKDNAEVKGIIEMLYNSIKLCMNSKMSEAILKQSQEELIYSFSAISESKSEQTGQHIKRVSEYMRVMGKSICQSTEEQNALACAAMLHDVGKLMIPPEILDKPDKLTEEEYEVIKSHNKFGAALLKGVQGDMMKMAYDIALEHHERWDGKGYLGLKGEEISYYARYVSVIDVFDALISKRSYKNPWTVEEAYAEIIKHNGTQFAPDAIRVFQERFEELVKVHEMYPDE